MNSTDIDQTSIISEIPIPWQIQLTLLVIFDIPPLICTIFLLINIFKNRLLRNSLHNHVIILLLLSVLPTQLIDIPFYIVYLSLGYVWPSNSTFCLFWLFISIGIFDTIVIIMGYGSIERHILVFHHQWLIKVKRRIFLHYIPLTVVIFYSLTFYIYAIFFPPCQTNFDYTKGWCSDPCYYNNEIISMYDTITNTILPTLTILVSNLALLFRVIIQKRRVTAQNRWRKHRKMIIQMVSVSSLFIIFNLPVAILILAYLWGLPADAGFVFGQYAYFFTYSIPLLLPFVCLTSLPEIYKALLKQFLTQCQKMHPRHTATIRPTS